MIRKKPYMDWWRIQSYALGVAVGIAIGAVFGIDIAIRLGLGK